MAHNKFFYYISSQNKLYDKNTCSEFSCNISFPYNIYGQRISMRVHELITCLTHDQSEIIEKPCKIVLTSHRHNQQNKVLCIFSLEEKRNIYEQYGKANLVKSFYLDIGQIDIPGDHITLSFRLETIEGEILNLIEKRPTILAIEFLCYKTIKMPIQFAITFSSASSKIHSGWNPYNFLRDLPDDISQKNLEYFEVALESIWIPPIVKDHIMKMSVNGEILRLNLNLVDNYSNLIRIMKKEISKLSGNKLRVKSNRVDNKPNGFIFILKSKKDEFELKFDENFQSFFKLSNNFITLNNQKTIFLHKVTNNVQLTIEKELEKIVQMKTDSPVVGLTCDLIKNVYINNEIIPILKTVDLTKTNELISFENCPVFYPCKSIHPTIQFKFISLATRKDVKFNTDGPIYITLLFQEKKNNKDIV